MKEKDEMGLNMKEKAKIDMNVSIIQKNDEKQIITGVVLEPDSIDSQEDIIRAEVIEKAAYDFLANSSMIGHEHDKGAPAVVVESYIAPQDLVINKDNVVKGSWVMSVKIYDEFWWKAVKSGDITGFSIGGEGYRVEAGADE